MIEKWKYLLALNTHPAIGSQTLGRLLQSFSPKELGNLPSSQLKALGFPLKTITAISEVQRQVDPDRIIEILDRLKIKIRTILDPQYPKLLKEIISPPVILYFKGFFEDNDEVALAVVGSRKMSPYGQMVTEEIVKGLAGEGLTIVSGLALGIDGVAHQTALNGHGRTIGVLACGLDQIYPVVHYQLGERIIAQNGALISEYPVGAHSLKQNFPLRNRIIAGLALGTLVIEAAENSGALLTARHALENNREVFAVPGEIFNGHSVGTNNLIKMGAKLVTSPEDILVELNLPQKRQQLILEEVIPDTKEEQELLVLLGEKPVHIDKISQISKLDIAAINSTLLMMEMKGKIKNLGGQQYIIAPRRKIKK
jgi:DNA processing protein